MRIRLLKPYQLMTVGEYLDPAAGVAAQLIARGIAVAEPEKHAKPQAAPAPGSAPGTAPHRARAKSKR